MFRVSQVALALCLSTTFLSPLRTNAFQTLPSKTLSHPLPNPAFLPRSTSTSLFLSSAPPADSKIKRLPESAVEVIVTASPKKTEGYYAKVLAEVSKTLTIPGFRKGSKIPPAVLENAMGKSGDRLAMRKQCINTLVGDLLEPVLKEEGLEPIGQPNLVEDVEAIAERFEAGKELQLRVKCDVWPVIKFKEAEGGGKGYVGLTGSYKRKPFDQAKMDKALSDLVERFATLDPMDDDSILGMGDACVVDMVGYFEGEDGTKGEPLPSAASGGDVEVILGKGRYMEGLVEGLIGAKVGDVREVKVSFPDKLRDKSLAGKKAVFDVTVKQSSHRILPEIDDEFAKKVRADLTKESLEAELRKAIDEEDSKEFVNERNGALSESLLKVIECEVPDTIVTQQAKDKYAGFMAEMRGQGTADAELKKMISPENFLKYKKIYKQGIVEDFSIGLAIDEIGTLEGISVPDNEIDEQIGQLKSEAAKEGEDFDESQIRGRVETTLRRRKVYDFLAENANLDVVYLEENAENVDGELMTELAEQALEREQQWAKEAVSNAQDAEIV